jgi:hypothetical protein
MRKNLLLALCFGALLAAVLSRAVAQPSPDETSFVAITNPAIGYDSAPVEDRVAKLNQALASGKAKLDWDPNGLGYLPSLLKNLDLNADSQVLVFSKTSFQAPLISPQAPRALFFNDNVALGSVHHGEVYELAALDPRQGVVFYTLDEHKSDKPTFVRRDVCLQCHQGPATLGVPGLMVASVYPDASGMPAFKLGEPVTDDRTPFEDRWGGWYVTGTHGGMTHRGNAIAPNPSQPDVLESRGTQNVTSLKGKFDPAGYMSQVSDIVALMTLEHQTRMTDLMTRIGWETRVAEHDGKMNDPQTKAQIDANIESMVTYMLFADEAKLYDPIEGVSTFTKTFSQRGPHDHLGRSLRDFDLHKRMFKYPLSYMIYSQEFDALPASAKDRIYRRLYDVLSGKDQSPKFARLSAEDRSNVLAILRDTKSDLPAYWRGTEPAAIAASSSRP